MIQSFPHIYKSREPISNYIFLEKVIFLSAQVARVEKEITFHTITF